MSFGLLGWSHPAHAVSGLTFTRITPFATLDSNNSCNAGPNAIYLQVNITNNSGSTLNNLTATFNGFTNPAFGGSWSTTPVSQFQLDAEETATRSIPTIANGATVRLYWFINYPCWGGGGAPPAKQATFTITVSDGVTASQTSGLLDVTTRSELSANAGGQMISQTVGAGAALGQIVPVTVVYDFGNVGSGNDLGIQPAGNRSHNSGCYQLVGDDVTNVTGVTGITTSDDNTLYKTGVSSGGGTNRITVVYYFKAVSTSCPSGTTVNPFADMVSGAQQKYSGNMGTCSSTPCVLTSPAPTNVLTLAKSVSPTSLPTGGTATYTVTITNPSSFDATLDSLTDTLPSGVTFGAIAAGSQIVAGNSAILPAAGASGTITFKAVDASTCTLPPTVACTWLVPANGTLTLKYTVSVPNTVGAYQNSIFGNIGAEQIDTTLSTSDNSPATSTVTVGTAPTVTKSFSPNPIAAGGTSTLTITLSNSNASALTGVNFTDTLPSSPAQMTVTAAPSSPQCGGTITNTATSVTLTNGTIPGAGSCTVVVNVSAPTAGSYTNTVPVGGVTTASGLSNTAAGSATLTVLSPPDLSVTKSDGGSSVAPGGTVAYTLTYSNTGGIGATGVVLTETVPTNTVFNAGASTAGWSCVPSNNAGSTCTLSVGSVAASAGGSATFAVTVSNPLPAGVSQISNTASIADDGTHGTDPTPANNSGSDTTPVTGAPDFSITKSDGGASVAPGGTVSYTLTYANGGSRGAAGVTITETVPTNTTFNAGASTAGWSCSPNNNAGSTCTLAIGTLAAGGGSQTATFAVTVANPLPAGVTQISNTASIADNGANGTDPTPGNNSGSDTTPVTGAPDMSITKSDGGASVAPGGTVSYTLTYSNTGNRGAAGVTITETVPANTTFNAGASTAGWSCSPNNNAGSTCTLSVGTVAASAGGSATFAVTVVNPLPAGVTQIANTATISDNGANGTDPNSANNSGSDTTPVTGAPDLSLTKSDGGASVAPGGTVAYTLTYSNTGNRGATGVTITETVPANTTFNAGASTAGWSCSPNNNTGSICTLSVGTVAASAGGSATFAVTVANPLPAGVTQIANSATITNDGTNGTDPNSGNNTGSDTTPVTGAPDLSVTKSDGGASVAPGGTVTYTLTYSNTGNRGATGVTLTEIVPANTTFNAGASTAGWSCSPNGNAGSTCTLAVGSIAASGGGSATFAVTVANPLLAGVTQISNTATISDDGANGADPTPSNNSGSDTTPVTGAPDLSITKSDGGASVAPGGTVAYTLTYSNTGNRGAAGVTITETVPADTTFNAGSSTAGWSCSPNNNAGSTCTLSVGTVAASAGGSATFAVTVANPLPAGVTQISNTATIADNGTNGTDPTPGNNTGSDTTPLTGGPDLSITKSDGGASVAPGGTVIYTLTYSNTGNRGATGVTITETVPTHTTFNAGSSTAGWVCTPNGNAGSTCTLTIGSVAASAGGSATFAVTVANPLPAGVTQIANTATIANDGANGTDPNTANNTGSDTTPLTGGPDLSVTKSDGGASVAPGGTVSYTLTYSNSGTRGATGVVLTETVPANTTFNAASSTAGWACSPNNNAGSTCTLAVGGLAAGSGNQTATFAVTVANPVAAGVTQISNTATISDDGANGTDSNPANNSGSDTTPVTGAPDLSITKSDGGASVTPGGTVTYTLTYSNGGNRGATGVTITETVPANTTFNAAASTAGWVCTPNGNAGSTCTLSIGSVAASAGGSATFAVTVSSSLGAGVTQISNTATIADDGTNGTDPNTANNSGSDTTPITAAPDLSITKSDGGVSVAPGGTVSYTLSYSNGGNKGATGVTITETVPANTTFNAASSTAGWVCTPNGNAGSTCTLSVGSVAASGSGSATFAVTVANPLPAGVTQISNTATIADDGTNGTDPNTANNTGSDTTPVTGAPDLSITKSDGGVSVAPGGTVTYTLTYSNSGNRGATGVTITETVPANTTFNAASSTAGWACAPNGNAGSTCTLNAGSVAAGGGSQTAAFAVTVASPLPAGVTQIANTAIIANDGANGTDPNTANNTGSDTTPVTGGPDLSITKSDGGVSVAPGGTVTYTLTYANAGNRDATGVVLTETVPANTTFNSASSTAGWVCTPNNNAGSTCTLSAGSVAAGSGNHTATFAVTVVNPVPNGVTQISNTATIADDGANGADPNPADNTGSDTTPVSSAPDLEITVSDGGVSASPGGIVTYTLTYANTGSTGATGVVITETVPANTTFNAAGSTAGWVCTPDNNAGSTCTLTIGNLGAGSGNQTATFAVTVANPLPNGVTQLTDAASIADDGKNGADPTPANNTGSDITPVAVVGPTLNPPTGFKAVSAQTSTSIQWRMVWINNQNSSSINVQITDPIPAGTTYVGGSVVCTPQGSSTTTMCTYDAVNNRIFWQGVIGTDQGANSEATAANEVVITFSVTVDPTVTHVVNQASALTDRNGNNDFSDEDPVSSVSTSNQAIWDRAVPAIPTLSEVGLAALFLLLAAAGWLILRRGLKPGRQE